MNDLILTSEREIQEGEVVIGKAETPEQMIGRLEVVTERYKNEGYLDEISVYYSELETEAIVGEDGFSVLEGNLPLDLYDEFMKKGLVIVSKEGKQLYIDKYHWQSIQFVAETTEGCVGSVRIILDKDQDGIPVFPLPTLTDSDIQLSPEWEEIACATKAELSQFAKVRNAHPGVAVGLLRAAYMCSLENGIEAWVATTDNRVVRMLNGTYLNFNLPKIGPSVMYLGSLSTPIYIDLEEALRSSEGYDSSYMTARFLRGEDIPGFEWYTGV